MTDETGKAAALSAALGALDRYRSIFRSAAQFGSDDILRRYAGMDPGTLIPLSLAHGVDVGQVSPPLDVQAPEPVHWAYNRDIAERAERFKPTALIPHPVLLLGRMRGEPARRGTIVVGPPPGPDNDRRLLDRLHGEGIRDASVLVKARGHYQGSIDFWRANGFDALTLGTMGRFRYEEMVVLFDRFETMVCPTMSSAAFFMAALGGQVRFLRGYVYSAYETAGYGPTLIAQFETAAGPMRRMIVAGDAERADFCRSLLGADLDLDPAAIRRNLADALGRAVAPVHFPKSYPWPVRAALLRIALATRRPGAIITPLADRFTRRTAGVAAVSLDEIAFWLEGPGPGTLEVRSTPFVRGVSEPGAAVGQYADTGGRPPC